MSSPNLTPLPRDAASPMPRTTANSAHSGRPGTASATVPPQNTSARPVIAARGGSRSAADISATAPSTWEKDAPNMLSADSYALVYPCSGALAEPGGPAAPEALGRLLGPARARVLVLLAAPKSTTHLVALTGRPLGSVGRHLRVLLDAGLVRRRRAGRSVLYYRTPLGDALAETDTDYRSL